jgi:hypothetical protein
MYLLQTLNLNCEMQCIGLAANLDLRWLQMDLLASREGASMLKVKYAHKTTYTVLSISYNVSELSSAIVFM